ncbi:ABC transporter ATP-binding protein [Aurantivibrio infirmus]
MNVAAIGNANFGNRNKPIVSLRNISRRFGDHYALRDINLHIPEGSVFGLMGLNGAGKTTLIKHILGLYKAQVGEVSVFGLNPVEEPEKVLSRFGYMSEVTDLPNWMRIDELIRYTKAFYPEWDTAYASSLLKHFDLGFSQKVGDLSKGQRARVALLLAVSHRPDLLILDEPSSGLDPLMRRDILRTVIKVVSDDGRSVLFSSHLLDEVERVADSIAIINKGKLITQGGLDEIKENYCRATLQFTDPLSSPPIIRGGTSWQGSGRQWECIYEGKKMSLENEAKSLNAELVNTSIPNLDQLFVALVGEEKMLAEEV